MSKPTWFRQTEKLLYDYKTFDSAIANLEVELKRAEAEARLPAPEYIMPQTTVSVVKLGQGTTKTPFDTSLTEKWGCLRAEIATRRVRYLRDLLQDKVRWRDAIREARQSLNEEESQLLWLRYDKEKSHGQVMEAMSRAGLCMSERNYYRLRNQVVERIAQFLGHDTNIREIGSNPAVSWQ